MRQNVVLFLFLALAAIYIWYGMEEKLLEAIELQNERADELAKPTPYHTRKLLFHTNIGSESENIDISSTPIDKFENTNFETRRNRVSHSSRESGKKISRRRKRRAQDSKEQLSWNFNLNVTRYENPKDKIEYPNESKVTHEKLKKDKYLGMSLSVSGNGPDQSLQELYQAWDSVGQFLKSLFGGNLEELKHKGHGVSLEMSPMPNGTKAMPPVELFMEGSGDEESQDGKKREGKFILGMFGFGVNNENPPKDEGSGETLDEQEFNATEFTLVSTTEVPNLKKSVTSSSNLDDTDLTINPTRNDDTSTITISQEEFSEANCTECKIETENASTDGIGSNEESSTLLSVLNTTIEFPFKNDALADFCNTLFARLQKFPQSVERSAGNEGSGSVAMDESGVTINAQSSNILTDEPRPQNFGFFERIWNRIMGRQNLPVQKALKESRGARLIDIDDLLVELGSGRELGVSSNIEFDNFQGGVTESEEDNEHFLSDCKAFFMNMQTDTRPNIFDLIHPHPEEKVATELTTLKSDESQHERVVTAFTTTGEQALDFESISQSESLTVLPFISETDQPKATEDDLLSKTPSEVQITTESEDKRLVQNDLWKPPGNFAESNDKIFTEVEVSSFSVRNLVEETTNISPEVQSTQSSNLSFFTDFNKNELITEELNITGSDEPRSFNLFGFGGSGADEGSADKSNINERTFGFFNFGSGERDIKEKDVSVEHTTEGVQERFFFPNFGSGGRELGPFNNSEWEVDEESNSTTDSRGRIFGFGSGERELKETLDTTTDTPDESSKSRKLSNDSTTTECDDSVQNFNDSDEFIAPSDTTTVKNDPRLIGTIFLTGSGEGGLFVDNKGPINLIQESEFTSPPAFQKPPQPGRGARKHDPEIEVRPRKEIERNFEVTEPLQLTSLQTLLTSQEHTVKNDVITSPNEALDKTTRFLETASDPLTVEPKIVDETIAPSSSFVTSMSVTELSVTTSGVVITTSQRITPRTKVLEFPKRFCSSASECNRALNERCIFSGTTALCDCGRSYVRSPETGKCESPVVLKTSLKLPGEVFHKDLKNRNSERFHKKRNDSIETMMLLLGDDPDLFRTIAGVDVSGFESGSLVVHWQITLAPNETNSIPSLIRQVDAELKEAFEDEALIERAPLNVTNAVLMAVTNDMDPCEKTERNYCSNNADCIPDPLRGFICRCRDEYIDKSMDIGHPGEVCIATCHPYYCGDHGMCSLKEDGNRHCTCNNLFFGERCEISGIIIIAGFASFNVVLIIVVCIVVCTCRKRRRRQSRFYGQNQVRFQPGAELGRFTASPRLADTIAMDDVRTTKTSKYMGISTPLHNAPTIQIISPSIMGSSVDYDYESTFDRTPSSGEASIEVHKTQETPKV